MEFWRDQVRHTDHMCEQHSHTLTREWRKVCLDFLISCAQVIDFVDNVVGEPAVLVGNSIGSLAALHVASTKPELTSGVVLINCAGGMNNKVKRMPGDFDGFGWQYKAVVPIFNVVLAIIDFVLQIEPIAKPLFDNVRNQERYGRMLESHSLIISCAAFSFINSPLFSSP